MTFTNEYVSNDDINRFKLDELLNGYLNTTVSYKHNWIIDKATNTWLLPIKKLNNSESLWVLHYKNTNIEIKLFETEKKGFDLISISQNKFNNTEIISTLHEALKTLDANGVVYATKKEIKSREDKKQTIVNIESKPKRKFIYLNILTAIIISVILFFIVNDSNKKNFKLNNDNNKTSKTNKPTEGKYNICATRYDGAFLTNSNDVYSGIKIIDSNLEQCNIDKYGNIYLISDKEKALYKANLDGTNIKKIVSIPLIPSGLAIDNDRERIFFAQWNKEIKAHEIVYTDLSGNNKTILISNRNLIRSVSGMFYDNINNKLYVSDSTAQQIVTIDLQTKYLKKIVSSRHPVGIIIDYENNKIIWIDRRDKNIYNANLDGSQKKILIDFNPSDNKAYVSINYALAIDTINNRLIFNYANKDGDHRYITETSNLDGSQRKKVKYKKGIFNSFTSFNSDFIESKITKQNYINNRNVVATIPKLKKCFSCHGKSWEKRALGKSMIVKDMSKENIYRALIGYKNGTYGGPMKRLMKGQLENYSAQELEAIAKTIKSQ